jgi:guanine deaminase
MKVYVGTVVHCISPTELEFVEGGAVVVNPDGVIEDVLRPPLHLDPSWHCESLGKRFIVPGLIDTHIHAPQYAQTGMGTDRPLLQWLEKYTFPTELRFANVEWARKVYRDVIRRTLRNGTTTAVYFASLHREASVELARLCQELGQHAWVGKVCMDRHGSTEYVEASAEASIEDATRVVEAIQAIGSPLVQPVVTPRFAITCSAPLLSSLGQLAHKHDLLVQTHIGENKEEIAFTMSLFPECRDYASVYSKAGLFRRGKTVLAHAVYLTDEELQTIAHAGCGIAHCPRSNLTLGSGLCHVRRIQAAGISVSMGTDVSGGPYPSIWDAMRGAVETSQCVHFQWPESSALSYKEAFYLGTLGGAKVVGMENELGSFAKGKWFNAQILDASKLDCYGTESVEDLFQKLFWLLDDRCIEQVYVKGRQVV